jgi:hypothetical protein
LSSDPYLGLPTMTPPDDDDAAAGNPPLRPETGLGGIFGFLLGDADGGGRRYIFIHTSNLLTRFSMKKMVAIWTNYLL